MEMKPANHKSLMDRLNNSEPEERHPLGRVPKIWRDFDIRQGDRRWECVVGTRRFLDLLKKLWHK
jgi:hypothetical protein